MWTRLSTLKEPQLEKIFVFSTKRESIVIISQEILLDALRSCSAIRTSGQTAGGSPAPRAGGDALRLIPALAAPAWAAPFPTLRTPATPTHPSLPNLHSQCWSWREEWLQLCTQP